MTKPGTEMPDFASHALTADQIRTHWPAVTQSMCEEAAQAATAREQERLEALVAAFPSDTVFAVTSFLAGADVLSAKAIFADVLQQRLAASEEARIAAESAAALAQAATPPMPAPGFSASDAPGDGEAQAAAKADWAANADGCRDTFSSQEIYLAYRRHTDR